jgi:plasmid maintenance system killer protein
MYKEEIQRILDGRAKVDITHNDKGFSIRVNQNYNLLIELAKIIVVLAGLDYAIHALF